MDGKMSLLLEQAEERRLELLKLGSGELEYTRPMPTAILKNTARIIGELAQILKNHQTVLQAEREGRVLVLPCKVGDEVYVLDRDAGEIKKKMVTVIGTTDFGNYQYSSVHLDRGPDDPIKAKHFSEFGLTVFLSREEAEKALRESNGN